ncbi:MAG: DUF5716 family protein [Bacteroidales bacterium]|nr:DUF5716 family protein [Bacteroidales bacterium]MCM1415105.1 DUF5716 family protein [bacterium]MCM1423961.1 DUF5716 family protein [bacterium]
MGSIMFLERKEEKPHKGSVFVGFDLGERYAQISYCFFEKGGVETLAPVAGTKQYNIPAMLCKRKGSKQWLYGREAAENADAEDLLPVEGLLSLARAGKELTLDGETYDPVALLTLFIRRSLGLLGIIAPPEEIDAFMVTVARTDDRMVEVLLQAAANLNLKTDRIFFQNHTESLYAYMLHQPAELWAYSALVCEHDGRRLTTYRMACNKRTTPIVALIEEQLFETLPLPGEDETEAVRTDAYRLADERFLDILEGLCEGRIVSSAYLLGDGFREEWHKESLRFLCKNRRVFQGNNLFSQGAVYSLLEKWDPSKEGKSHIFLGEDKLKANIGMYVLRRGKESYYALLDAGENWYDLHKTCEILLEDDKTLSFVITPLTGRNPQTKDITLSGAKKTEAPFTRYELDVSMVSADTVQVTATELGLGELFPTDGRKWEESFQIL